MRHPRVCVRLVILVAQATGKEVMARIPHAAHIDFSFSDLTRELPDFRSRISPGNFARKRFHFL